ncbi:MAG: thioredoxin-disulfide reductase [Pseudomonadota bacterium]
MHKTQHKLLIIGAGPAGYSAAIYAARAGLSPVIVTGLQPGGQLMITTVVENYPGFADIIQGPWLMEQMRLQAEHVGTKFVFDTIIDVNLDQEPILAHGDSGDCYACDSLIIATGAKARWLFCKGEKTYKGFGVSACATCDGFFFKNKKVAVVGGGNTAIEEALYLTRHASQVFLIHRRDQLRGELILQKRLLEHPKIECIWNHEVVEMSGSENPKALNSITLKSTLDQKLRPLSIDGCFVAIGHDPATEIFKGKLDMDKNGYLRHKPDSTMTNKSGIFCAGDVCDHVYRQAVTAAGMGCMAALEAERYLAAK